MRCEVCRDANSTEILRAGLNMYIQYTVFYKHKIKLSYCEPVKRLAGQCTTVYCNNNRNNHLHVLTDLKWKVCYLKKKNVEKCLLNQERDVHLSDAVNMVKRLVHTPYSGISELLRMVVFKRVSVKKESN